MAEQPEPATPKILPDDGPEQQYRFALSRALQMILKWQKLPFPSSETFMLSMNVPLMRCSGWSRHPVHGNALLKITAIALCRMAEYQDDPRQIETSLWIAESVAQFASPEQACDVYKPTCGVA